MIRPTALSLSQTWQTLRRVSRILWVRVALISALSIAAALSAGLLDPLIPQASKDRFSAEATLPVLNVLASSMLAVATFSLGIMVSSHRTLADQSTPRIHQLLMEDTSTQSVLATFIGAFVFALSAIILFRAGYYDQSAVVIVFVATVMVVLAIVVSLIRWIGRLSQIGSLQYALDRAEDSARSVLNTHREWPCMGALAVTDAAAAAANTPVRAQASGYVTRIQLADLQERAEKDKARVVLSVRPGDHVLSGEIVARLDGDADPEAYAGCILLGQNRSYDQDPRYAIRTLRESAQKALSPGINDPGTAMDVTARLERLLWEATEPIEKKEALYDRVYLPEYAPDALVDMAFRAIARDGRTNVSVLARVAAAVDKLSQRCGSDRTEALARDIVAFGQDGLTAAPDRAGFSDRRG
ncbi:DUF2254 domain-containing protein [Thalassococcus sp. CAU 1522]|uniref:DUF2254 domain-containing protein n=1 Tax=Thalassococcus arenae TaxID=2851652 RepID=A0ABS6N307_9RHOB|nr:DUF2254 domain-containing protein [Thalassococcus arenae]MBV2358400.1 DUF2254 domain-containing protein [Thalassococcus arenae]